MSDASYEQDISNLRLNAPIFDADRRFQAELNKFLKTNGYALTKSDAAGLHPVELADSEVQESTDQIGETKIVQDENTGEIVSYNKNGITLAKHETDGDWYMHNDQGGDFVKVKPDSIKLNQSGDVSYTVEIWLSPPKRTLGENDSNYLWGNSWWS